MLVIGPDPGEIATVTGGRAVGRGRGRRVGRFDSRMLDRRRVLRRAARPSATVTSSSPMPFAARREPSRSSSATPRRGCRRRRSCVVDDSCAALARGRGWSAPPARGRRGRRRHRFDGQDVDEGPDRRGARVPRSSCTRARRRSTTRSGCRSRCSTRPDAGAVVWPRWATASPATSVSCATIARPSIGVITHIGLAHAEHLGGPDGVAAVIGELLDALPVDGLAVLNAD